MTEYYSIPGEDFSCNGCINKSGELGVDFCNDKVCNGIIWKIKEEIVIEQKDYEVFLIEYLENHSEEVKREYYVAQVDTILSDIKDVIQHSPLKDEIINAIKNYEYGYNEDGSSEIDESIRKMSQKLGYR